NIASRYKATIPIGVALRGPAKRIKNMQEPTASILQKNKPNISDASATNKRTKIFNEVPPLTIENIIDSIILTSSSKDEN
ncbi:16404_t:CDS:2, partial [Funneliformis geosporum]